MAEEKQIGDKNKQQKIIKNENNISKQKTKGSKYLNRKMAEIEAKKYIKTIKTDTVENEPPLLVAVIGSVGVGKTTLIRSLVKRYTKQKLDNIKGPITVFAEKDKRVTFFECENEITSMIDISKVADLVVLVIDSSFGLEMETFEFVSILKAHGFCRLVGVLTKLDLIEKNEKKIEIKKQIKDRFHSDIYDAAKLFYLTGLSKNSYKEKEMINFSRFISTAKKHPLVWKTTHSYVHVDKFEKNINNTTKETIDVSFYGYLRGRPMKSGSDVCIPGMGDFKVENIVSILDPCPLKEKNKKKIKKIVEQNKIIYAPMSNFENINDESIIYINVKDIKPTKLNINNIKKIEDISLIKESVFHLKKDEEKKDEHVIPKKQDTLLIENHIKEEEEEIQEESSLDEEILEDEEKIASLKKRFVFGESDDESDDEKKRDLKIKKIEERFEDITKEEDIKDEKSTQAELEELVEKRKHFGGYPGEYVKIIIKNISNEFIKNIRPKKPILIGFVESTKNVFITAKIIRQRFFPRILKTKEPLIFSVGWRRFQTIPIFSLQDATRNKMLKYTPENMYCFVTFYGPYIPQGTGVCAFKKLTTEDGFRVSVSGTVVEMKTESNILKKLKLIGKPVEIKQKTAFISDMFTSSLEVAMFEGGLLKTTSGIRGKIKKAVHNSGMFRATFEDKIQMSDIVFMRTWHKVIPPDYFNPMTELLGEWKKMKLNKELREIHSISLKQKEDSLYRKIERPMQEEKDLVVSEKILKTLPFSIREKNFSIDKKTSLNTKLDILDFDEKKNRDDLSYLKTLKEEKEKEYIKKQENRKIEETVSIEKKKLEKQEKEKKYLKKIWLKKQVKETKTKKKRK